MYLYSPLAYTDCNALNDDVAKRGWAECRAGGKTQIVSHLFVHTLDYKSSIHMLIDATD